MRLTDDDVARFESRIKAQARPCPFCGASAWTVCREAHVAPRVGEGPTVDGIVLLLAICRSCGLVLSFTPQEDW